LALLIEPPRGLVGVLLDLASQLVADRPRLKTSVLEGDVGLSI
jgi:hypothetical protein